MIFYKSDGTWFDKDTLAIRLVETIDGDGLYYGYRNGFPDEEVCSISEFEKVEI